MSDGLLRATRGPFVGGYTSAVPPFMAGADQLIGNQDGTDTNSSRDCVIDPVSGSVSKRMGSAPVGDSLATIAGMTNKVMGFKPRRLFALDSPSITDAYPVMATLNGKDTNAGFPTADVGFPGTLTVRSTNGADSFYSLLEEFGTTHYKTGPDSGHTSASYNIKMVPIHVDSGDGVYNRGALTGTAGTDKFMQQFLTCGSRSMLQTQSWAYFPNLRATPWRWNKRLNESDGAGSEVFRGYPTGPFSALFPPVGTAGGTSANNSTWVDGDTFAVSVVFQFEDGSYSMPFVPRLPNATLTSGIGLVTVGSIGGSNKYQFVTYTNVAIGPEGTVARILLRTPKQNRAAAGDTITVSPLDLRVLGVLRNNTQTTFVDYGGDDDSLVEDENVIRFDLVCPRRARHIGTGDHRSLIGYTLPNTAAILISQVSVNGSATAYDRNLSDTADFNYAGANAALVRVTSTNLELLNIAQGGTPGGTNLTQLAFATYTTLESLVDAINATSESSNAERWAAQLAPGIDGTIASTSLTKTTFDLACATTDTLTTVTSAALFGPVGVGMKVSGTGITAGTYVVSKASASSLTISTAATATGSPTLTFYQETGDNAIVSGGTLGYMRCFGPNYPLLLCVKPSALPNYDKPDKQAVYYTMASPGAVQSGSSLAANSFLAGNKLLGPLNPRPQMQRMVQGIVDIEGAAVVAYTDGIALFTNRRGGTTGEDFDYRLFDVNNTRGCISWPGLVSGNGWASYPTTEGIMACDKTGKEVNISGAVFNSSDLTGDLAYEILTSAASAASDSDDQYLVAAVQGTKLVVSVRSAQIGSGEDARVLSYDFSRGVDANGLEELLDPERRTTYIWNPPAIYNNGGGFTTIGAIGSMRNASGRQDFLVYEATGLTGDNVLLQTGTTTQDNSIAVSSFAVVAPVVASEFMALSPQRFEATHLTGASSAVIDLANNQTPTFNTGLARVLQVDTSRTRYNKQSIPIDQTQRGKTDMLWLRWRSTTNVVTNKLWRLVIEYGEVESDTVMPTLS